MSTSIGKIGYKVNASTFHALGLRIITQSGQQRPDVFDDDLFDHDEEYTLQNLQHFLI